MRGSGLGREWFHFLLKKKCPSPLSGKECPKLYCIIHEVDLTIMNCLISNLIYSANRISTGSSCVKCNKFLHFNFLTTAPKAGGCHLHTPSFVPANLSTFLRYHVMWVPVENRWYCPWRGGTN